VINTARMASAYYTSGRSSTPAVAQTTYATNSTTVASTPKGKEVSTVIFIIVVVVTVILGLILGLMWFLLQGCRKVTTNGNNCANAPNPNADITCPSGTNCCASGRHICVGVSGSKCFGNGNCPIGSTCQKGLCT
jgi:hypothetical protein